VGICPTWANPHLASRRVRVPSRSSADLF